MAKEYRTVNIYPQTMTFMFGGTTLVRDLTPEQRVILEQYYWDRGFRVAWK